MTYSEIVDLIDEKLASGIRIPATDHREVEIALLDYINDNLPKQYDIKYIWADTTYLGDNFETSGLGKLLRLGWAICNGNNGTPNLGGKMIMTYGGDYTTLNATGGYKDSVLIQHEHLNGVADDNGQFFVYEKVLTDMPGLATKSIQSEGTARTYQGKTSSIGESGIGKNLPPYHILTAIMKL